MYEFKPFTINIGGKLLEINRPLVMGILNATPDSFYGGSRCSETDRIAGRIEEMVRDGADIIDIGGYSSRPNADDVTAEEEYRRLESVLKVRREIAPEIPVSIDTFRADVARKCIENFGAMIVNDISGGDLDENMFATVAELKVPYILMHMRGNPKTMQSLTDYEDGVVVGVISDLAKKVHRLSRMGVCDVIVDPGFGFSKDLEQNYRLMAHLEEFHALRLPLLVGISRKSMIFRALGTTPDGALNGTTALNVVSLMAGAHILRVHDVKEAVEAVKIVELIRNQH